MNNERLLRRLRSHPQVMENDKVTRLILKVKARLKPQWDARAELVQKARSDAYMRMMT